MVVPATALGPELVASVLMVSESHLLIQKGQAPSTMLTAQLTGEHGLHRFLCAAQAAR